MRRLAWALACALVAGAAAAGELKPWSGGPAPSLVLTDLQGVEHRLADYRGRVLVLNFWATWCEPCREEMPSLARLRRQMADAPFTILAIDYGEGAVRIAAFLEKVPIDFPILLDRDLAVAKAWKARVLPYTVIVDPQSRIRYAAVGALDWSAPEVEQLVRQLLKAP